MDRQGRATPFQETTPGRRRLLAGALAGGAQLFLVGMLFLPAQQAQPTKPEPALQVSLLPAPKPPGPSEAEEAAAGAPQIAPPPMPQAVAPTLIIAAVPLSDTSDLLSDSQLAGAARAGEGSGGGSGCDMAAAVQQALRRDRLVPAAVADAGRLGKSSMLWNGDWVRAGGQEGKGLAAVRQAVIWEVGFAPLACRNAPMRGLVLLSLADGRTRFAVGAGNWRWSDLLGLRSPAVR